MESQEMLLTNTNNTIVLDDDYIVSLQDLVKVAREAEHVFVSPAVTERIKLAHEVIQQSINDQAQAVYGLTTGLGSQKDVRISNDSLGAYNTSIIVDHAAAVGPEVSADVVRGTIFARLCALSRGGSGISSETFHALLTLLNEQVVPVVRVWGSVGEADLAPLAQVGLVLIGEGTAWYKQKRMTGAEALHCVGMHGIELQPRDGLALIGTNSYSSSVAGLAVWDAQSCQLWSETAATLSWIAFGANKSALHVDVLHHHSAEAAEIARRMANFLSSANYIERNLQDPLSFRCIPQVYASLERAMKRTETCVLSKLASPLDNPFLLNGPQQFISNGNFDATDLTMESDSLRNVMYRVIVLSERRVSKLLATHFSGLPAGLSVKEGYTGLDVLHHTLLSLLGEAERLAQISPTQCGMAAEGVEDYGSMAAHSAMSLQQLVRIWRLSIAIELVIATHALHLRKIPVRNPLLVHIERVESAIKEGRTPSDMTLAVERLMMDKSYSTL